ncbi:hypothetical protein [Arthrobacter rhizosphaerae]|uniref:hypothetical protein n=1 Tax=Arthrobacter rhizosphaerae TaxID=2855490 RepID=UPI001FF64C43|nr:hypothetical protein [Arthrobacter rhizosphaerae]
MPHQPDESNDSRHPQVTSHQVEESPEEIVEYWTPERMAKASPAERTLEVPGPAEGPAEDQLPEKDLSESD